MHDGFGSRITGISIATELRIQAVPQQISDLQGLEGYEAARLLLSESRTVCHLRANQFHNSPRAR